MSSALYWRARRCHLIKGLSVSSFLSKLHEMVTNPTNASNSERHRRGLFEMAATNRQSKPMKQTIGAISITNKTESFALLTIRDSNNPPAVSTAANGSHQISRSGGAD